MDIGNIKGGVWCHGAYEITVRDNGTEYESESE